MPKELIKLYDKQTGRDLVGIRDTETGSVMRMPTLTEADQPLFEQYVRPTDPMGPNGLPKLGGNFPIGDDPGFRHTVQAPTGIEYIQTPATTFAENLPAALPFAAGFIPGIGKLTAPLFSAGGELGKAVLQNEWPTTFGGDPDRKLSPDEIMQNMGISAGLDVAMMGTGQIAKHSELRPWAQRMARRFFPIDKSKNAADFQTPHTSVGPQEMTVGHGNERAMRFQSAFAHKATVEAFKRIRDQAAQTFGPWMGKVQNIMGQGVQQAENYASQLGFLRDADHARWMTHVDDAANSRTVRVMVPNKKGGMTPVNQKVPGAIEVNQSLPMAQQELKRVQAILNPNNVSTANLRDKFGTQLKDVETELKAITGIKKPIGGNPVERISRLEHLYDRLGEHIDSLPPGSEIARTLSGLRSSVGNDIKAGVKAWGPTAEAAYNNYQGSLARLSDQIDPKRAQELRNALKSEGKTLKDITDEALADPQKMEELVRRTKDTQKDLGQQLVQDAVSKAGYTASDKTFDATLSLNKFMELKNSGVLDHALRPSEMINMEAFLRFAQHTPGGLQSSIDNALMLTWGRAGLTLGSRAVMGALSVAGLGGLGKAGYDYSQGNAVDPKTLYAGLMTLSLPAMNMLVKKALLDPKVAAVVRGVAQVDKPSAQREARAKALVHLLRGARIFATNYAGFPIEGEIGENGVTFPQPPSPMLPQKKKLNIIESQQQVQY